MKATFLVAGLLALSGTASAQLDPLTLPNPRPASKGQYQYGVEMLRLDAAWALTRGRAPIAIVDGGLMPSHVELQPGPEGNVRFHVSEDMTDTLRPTSYHALMVTGAIVASGSNGRGITGACPRCSASLHNFRRGIFASLSAGVASGAVVLNMSFGGGGANNEEPPSCANGRQNAEICTSSRLAEERDVMMVTIAGNVPVNRLGAFSPEPGVVTVGGVEPDGSFWNDSYGATYNNGSSWGPNLRLVAPARDLLTIHPFGATFDPGIRCGERIDSTLGAERTMGEAYAGYGNCLGTSFAAPWVSGIVGLVRSANPLLTNEQVRTILYETAVTPVAGPEGLTFYLPDAQAAVRRALGVGNVNRLTPMFSLFSANAGRHLFTSVPQVAVAAIAGELPVNGVDARPFFESVGESIPSYATFNGAICRAGNCVRPQARRGFSVFTTEASPDGPPLVPLYRLTQVCARGSPGCASTRAFAYATSETQARALGEQGYVVDMIEGYVYPPVLADPPPGGRRLCMAYDAARIDHILYAAAQCDRASLPDGAGGTTGGSYAHVRLLGYVVDEMPEAPNHTALWWNADESGWGLNLTHQGDVLFGTLFTYDANRNPMWLVMPTGLRSGSNYSGTLYRTTGSPFDAVPFTPIAPSNITRVGDMRVTFTAAGANVTYDVNGATVTKAVTRQVFGAAAATCRNTAGSRGSLANYQDLWWNPAESGWGLNVTQQGELIFATLFTYGLDGNGLWLVMPEGRRQPDGRFTGDLYRTRGSPFDATPVVPLAAADVTRVGSMTVRFSDGENGMLDYSIEGASVRKSITRQVFASPQASCSG